jgi:quercetin dioxygenase-like cupin family protein
MSAFASVRSLSPVRIWEGITGRLVEGERATFAVIELDPGAAATPHQHPHEQLGVLIEGTLTFRIGGETRELAPGGTWRIPGDTEHEVTAGPDGATLVEVFAPVREDWAGLPRLERAPRWPR